MVALYQPNMWSEGVIKLGMNMKKNEKN